MLIESRTNSMVGGMLSKSKAKPTTYLVTVPVFNRLKDSDVERFLSEPRNKDSKPSTRDKREHAVKRYYSSLRFPDSSMDIPFSD